MFSAYTLSERERERERGVSWNEYYPEFEYYNQYG